jgi:hypothetical protein
LPKLDSGEGLIGLLSVDLIFGVFISSIIFYLFYFFSIHHFPEKIKICCDLRNNLCHNTC